MGNYTEEQMAFLHAKITELLTITEELESQFARPFPMDGHLLGSIGEIFAAWHYGIALYKPSADRHDGLAPDGREVQVKLTQGDYFSFRKAPDYLIALHLNQVTGQIREIYNGPGTGLQKRVYLTKLVELDRSVPDGERIAALHSVEKYQKIEIEQKTKNKQKQTTVQRKRNRKTLVLCEECHKKIHA